MSVAFFDAEYNTNSSMIKERTQFDVIQISLLCDGDFFSCYVRPKLHPILTKHILNLTNISQFDVDSGEPFDVVMSKLYKFIDLHHITDIVVWGHRDKEYLLKEFYNYENMNKSLFSGFLNKFIDLCDLVSKDIFKNSNSLISQHDAMYVYGLESSDSHNSYTDVINLQMLYNSIFYDDLNNIDYKNRLELYLKYFSCKQKYGRLRSRVYSAYRYGKSIEKLCKEFELPYEYVLQIIEKSNQNNTLYMSIEEWLIKGDAVLTK